MQNWNNSGKCTPPAVRGFRCLPAEIFYCARSRAFKCQMCHQTKQKRWKHLFFIGSPQYSLVKWKPSFKKMAVQLSQWLRIRNWEGKPAFLRVDTGCEGFFLFGSPWIAVGWTECSYYNIPLGRLALFCYFLPSEIFRDFLTNLYQTKFPWLWLTYSVKAKIQIAERFSHPE